MRLLREIGHFARDALGLLALQIGRGFFALGYALVCDELRASLERITDRQARIRIERMGGGDSWAEQ